MSLIVEAGKLRQRVNIQAVTQTRNPDGGIVETWATTDTVWAQVLPLFGREFFTSRQATAAVTHRVLLRNYTGLTVANRILYDSRILNIASVVDRRERGKITEVVCVEDIDVTNTPSLELIPASGAIVVSSTSVGAVGHTHSRDVPSGGITTSATAPLIAETRMPGAADIAVSSSAATVDNSRDVAVPVVGAVAITPTAPDVLPSTAGKYNLVVSGGAPSVGHGVAGVVLDMALSFTAPAVA